MVASAFSTLSARLTIKEKAADAQDWKRRKAETLWKEAVELQNAGNFSKSLVKWADSAKFESDSSVPRPDFLAHVYNVIGYCHYRTRDYPASKEYYERALKTYSKISIFKSPDAASTMNNYALLLLEMGEEERAEKIIKESLKILEKSVGSDSPLLAYILNNMARAYNRLKKYEESEKILVRALEIEGKMMVSASPEVVTTLELLAVAAFNLKAYDRAEPLFIQVVKQREEAKGDEHPSVISALFALGNFYSDTGAYEKGEPVFKRCMDILDLNYGAGHRFSGVFLNQLGWVAAKRGQLDEAGEMFDRSITIAENFIVEHRIELAVSIYNSVAIGYKTENSEHAGDKLIRAMALFASTDKVEYLPVVQYAFSVFLKQGEHDVIAVFFGKRAIQSAIDRRERGLGDYNLPRWLFYKADDVPGYLTGLFEELDLLKDSQSMWAKLNSQRVPASALHAKVGKHLRGLWELSDREKIWDGQYNDWLEQARLWGEIEDTLESDAGSEPVMATGRYDSLGGVIAGFVELVDNFKSSQAGTKIG